MPFHTDTERRKNERARSKNNGKSVKPGSTSGGRVRRTRRRARPAVRKTN